MCQDTPVVIKQNLSQTKGWWLDVGVKRRESRITAGNSVPKKVRLFKTLTAAMVLSVSAYLASCSDLPQETYTGAIIFTYSSKEFPKVIIEKLCDTNSDSTDSYFYVPVWQKAQADNLGVELSMNLTCYPEPIQIPAELFNAAGSSYPISMPVLSAYLKENYHSLREHTFIVMNHFLTVDERYDNNFYVGPGSFFLATIEDGNGFITLPTRRTFAHEFNHLLGATDKYGTTRERACIIDPETGKEYDGYDIMCHRIPTNPDNPNSSYAMPPLEELIISEPTAKEIGWPLALK